MTLRAVAQQQGDSAAPEPDALASELQALVSHHATLATRLTRATLTDDPGFVDAAESALVRNIDDLEAALTPAVGADAAQQLSSQWEHQTQSLFQSATGLRDDQPSTKQRAEQRLDRIADEQASALAALGDGRVDEDHVADLLQSYFGDHMEQLERYAAGDYGRAYELQRQAFAAAFPIGTATASAGVRIPKSSPTDELRTALSRLLGEHVELAVDTMRAGATGSEDFEAAADALDANTRDMAAAMDALFGAKQAQKFNEVWADHIDLFVDYTVAVVEGDEASKRAVREQFKAVMRRFGTTLEEITGGLVDADVVTAAMGEHEQHLIDQIEQYAMDNYSAAHEVSYTACHARDDHRGQQSRPTAP
ncbi:MAG: hypothetical protein KY460_11770, partial [Actinobacteria bacterium]|nr:hypothetical protein [Actinomycetota bacterium]